MVGFFFFSSVVVVMSALVGGVRVVLVVVPVAAAGLTIAGAGAVAVGALAVPVCGAAVACCLVHSSYCSTPGRLLSTCVDALVGWLVGWLVVSSAAWRLFACGRAGFGWWRVHRFVGAGWMAWLAASAVFSVVVGACCACGLVAVSDVWVRSWLPARAWVVSFCPRIRDLDGGGVFGCVSWLSGFWWVGYMEVIALL